MNKRNVLAVMLASTVALSWTSPTIMVVTLAIGFYLVSAYTNDSKAYLYAIVSGLALFVHAGVTEQSTYVKVVTVLVGLEAMSIAYLSYRRIAGFSNNSILVLVSCAQLAMILASILGLLDGVVKMPAVWSMAAVLAMTTALLTGIPAMTLDNKYFFIPLTVVSWAMTAMSIGLGEWDTPAVALTNTLMLAGLYITSGPSSKPKQTG